MSIMAGVVTYVVANFTLFKEKCQRVFGGAIYSGDKYAEAIEDQSVLPRVMEVEVVCRLFGVLVVMLSCAGTVLSVHGTPSEHGVIHLRLSPDSYTVLHAQGTQGYTALRCKCTSTEHFRRAHIIFEATEDAQADPAPTPKARIHGLLFCPQKYLSTQVHLQWKRWRRKLKNSSRTSATSVPRYNIQESLCNRQGRT